MDTLPMIFRRCFPELPFTLNKSEWFLTLPNRSEIWLAGLDDKDRTEKVLGKEFVTIYLNEVSQISWSARNYAVTRLAQVCPYEIEGHPGELARKMYCDCNPPSKSHWAYQVFHQFRDPETKAALTETGNYARLAMNPRDNPHLPADYIRELEAQSGRMRRRFLEGLYGDVAPGALWTEELLDTHRISDGELPDMVRVGVAVDPSGADDSDNAENDEIGIIVGGVGTDNRGYVLEDLTLKAGPKKWAGVACGAYDRHGADFIVGEKNFGGEMVRYVIASHPQEGPLKRTIKLVTASRGKVVRAEPVAALHEQGKIKLAGRFLKLEEELLGMTTHGYTGERSPNRADAFVWLFSELFPQIVKKDRPKAPSATHAPLEPVGEQAWMA